MNTRDTLDTQLNVLENFNPVVPEKYQESEAYLLLLGEIITALKVQNKEQEKVLTL